MARLLALVQPTAAAFWGAPRPPQTSRVGAEQTRVLYRCIPLSFAVSAVCATLLSVQLAQYLSSAALTLWLIAAYGTSGLCALLWGCYGYARPTVAQLPWWDEVMVLAVALTGLTWGCGGLLLHVPGHFGQQMLVLLVMLNLSLAGLLLASCSVRAFMAFVVPVLSLPAIPFVASRELTCTLMGLATLALLPCLCVVAQRLARYHERTIQFHLHLRRLTGQLRAQKRTLERASQSKSRFLALASHDLRQPLHALDLMVKGLQGMPATELGPQGRELVANVRTCVSSLEELFTALLQISRLDAGAINTRLVSFPLQAVFERLRLELGVLAQEKQLRWAIPPTKVWVRSDPDLLLQILRNFLGNAIRNTCEGGVLIGCRWEPARARIEVRDSGCGIAHEQQERIFEEFIQLNNPERDPRQGMGLGLPITARLARLLSHPLSVRSAAGAGSVFGVSVPRVAPEERVLPADLSRKAQGVDLTSLTVLVLDEDTPARQELERRMSSWGCQVVGAASGAEAVSRLAALGCPPDVILADERLRGQAFEAGGLQDQSGLEAPVLLVMAGTAEACRDCQASGVPVLPKPVGPARLRTFLMHMASQPGRGGARRAAAGGAACLAGLQSRERGSGALDSPFSAASCPDGERSGPPGCGSGRAVP